MSALFSTADYTDALAALRPRGRVWPDDASAEQRQVLSACAASFERLDDGAQTLLVDAFPSSSTELLGEWEETCALPDPALGPASTIEQRRAQVVGRITGIGGQSIASLTAYAAALGFTITVTTYAPLRCSLGGCGDPLGGPEWSFAWGVQVVANSGGLSTDVLLAELAKVAPAETTVFLGS